VLNNQSFSKAFCKFEMIQSQKCLNHTYSKTLKKEFPGLPVAKGSAMSWWLLWNRKLVKISKKWKTLWGLPECTQICKTFPFCVLSYWQNILEKKRKSTET